MGTFSNKIRTIIGSDVGLWKGAGRLLFFFLHPSRIKMLLHKFYKKKLSIKPTYKIWAKAEDEYLRQLAKQNTIDTIRFFIIHHTEHKPNQLYKNVVYSTYEEARQLITQTYDYVIYVPQFALLNPYACDVLAQEIIKSNAAILTFDCDQIIDGKRTNPLFNKVWNRIDAQTFINLGCVCHRHDLLNEVEKSIGKLIIKDSLFSIPSIRIKHVLISHQSPYFTSKFETPTLSKNPFVSIIIPTHNKANLLKQCVDSILQKSTYSFFEIIVVDNNSTQIELAELLEEYKQKLKEKFVVLEANYDFNFSQLVNEGVAQAKGDFILLLNNDVEVISADWMEQMLSLAVSSWCGAVGSLLHYPDNKVQHAGIIVNEENGVEHVFAGSSSLENDLLNSLQVYSAVTAACLMVRKSTYQKVDGFDTDFKVEFNDIDFCLKLLSLGLINVFTPYAKLYHYESASRQHPFSSPKSAKRYWNERKLFESKWKNAISDDLYWHTNSSLFGL